MTDFSYNPENKELTIKLADMLDREALPGEVLDENTPDDEARRIIKGRLDRLQTRLNHG